MEKANPGGMVEDIGKVVILNGEDILTPAKAGALFGVSGWAMYKRAKKGTVPAHRLGKKLYFFRSEILHMVVNLQNP